MSVKIGILTTETNHHIYFVRELIKIYKNLTVFCETSNNALFSSQVLHPYEKKRNEYELKIWFKDKRLKFEDVAPTYRFNSLNSIDAVQSLEKNNSDLLVVFGTGPLKKSIIDIKPNHVFNLHGGDPEKYRGLDSHLWSIYNNDFLSLITTLHRLDLKLDTGDIVFKSLIPLYANLPLYALRQLNTNICIKLTIKLIETFKSNGVILSRPQRKLGNYYSSMPNNLKSICEKKFNKFISSKYHVQ